MQKRMITKVGSFTALALIGGLALAGCSSPGSTVAADCKPKHDGINTISSGKLTVGVIDIPPFSSYNSGTPEGIDISIVKKIAADECLEPVWQQATYADAVQSISNQSIDIAVGTIDATEKRLQAVDFSASTYLDGMGIVTKSGAKTVADLDSISGDIGTIDGYLWVEDLKKIFGNRVKTYPSSVELKADFDAGRLAVDIDAYGTAVVQFKDVSGVTVSLATEKPDPRIQALNPAPEAAFPLTKGNTSLKNALDADIADQRADGSIAGFLTDAGLSTSLGEVQKTQYVVPLS